MLFCHPDNIKWDSVQLEVSLPPTYHQSFMYGADFYDSFKDHYFNHELRMIFHLPIKQSIRYVAGRYYLTVQKLAHIEYYQHNEDDGGDIRCVSQNFNHYPKLHLVK